MARDYRKRMVWTADKIAILREFYPGQRTSEVAALIGCAINSVHAKAAQLGIKKTREAIARNAREAMANPNHPAHRSRFVKGSAPWNKDLRYQAGGRSVQTQFKAGRVPINWMPIGSERIRSDGYRERKLTDTGISRRDFVLIHHIVWKEAGRAIPTGHTLVFKDGNKTNFALDNLELISRAELMRRNSVHNLGPEVFAAKQLLGAITRQINKRNKA